MTENKAAKTTKKLTPADRVTKAPTSTHKAFAEWLESQTDGKVKATDEFVKAVQLTVTLWHQFQSSDENRKRHEQETADREAAKAARLQEKADKLQKQLADAKEAASKVKPPTKADVAKIKAARPAARAAEAKDLGKGKVATTKSSK